MERKSERKRDRTLISIIKVSVWPLVDKASTSFAEMYSKGYLVKDDKGQQMPFSSSEYIYDPFIPEARKFVFDRLVAGYVSHGIKVRTTPASPPTLVHSTNLSLFKTFWLDGGGYFSMSKIS